MITFEAADAFFHREAGTHRLLQRAKPRQCRKVFVGRVVHTRSDQKVTTDAIRARVKRSARRWAGHRLTYERSSDFGLYTGRMV